jgi:hypothetical protein
VLASEILPDLVAPATPRPSRDSSTNTLIRRYRELRDAR